MEKERKKERRDNKNPEYPRLYFKKVNSYGSYGNVNFVGLR